MAKKSTDQSSLGTKIYLSNPWNLVKTGFLLLTWIVMSIHIELIGPTMPMIAANINADYSDMGTALASRGAGYLAANILGVILQNIVKKHSDGILICAFILPAIVVFVTPFVKSLILLSILFFIHGIAHGLTDLGGTNLLLTMWGGNAAAPLNTVHLGYGIGAVLVNFLVRPFITEKVLSDDDPVDSSTLSSVNEITAKSNIFVPYTITAVLCVLIAVGHIFYYIRELIPQKQKLEVRQVDYAVVSTNPENVSPPIDKEPTSSYSPRTCGGGYFQYGLINSIIFIFSIFFIVGNDQTFSKFFFIYLKSDKFNISTGAASWGVILYWLSYSVGRLILAVVSVYKPVTTCLNVVWCGGLCLAIAWFMFVWLVGLTGISLFILGAGSGLIFSPLIPLTFALFNQRLNVVPILLALVLCGLALGVMTFQKIAGFVMDRNPNHFPTLLIVCMLMSILLYILSNFVYFFHQRKHPLNAQASTTNDAAVSPEDFNDDEQNMAKYLTEQEEI